MLNSSLNSPVLHASPSPSSATGVTVCFLEPLSVHQGSECCIPPNIMELLAASQTPCSLESFFFMLCALLNGSKQPAEVGKEDCLPSPLIQEQPGFHVVC